MTIKWALVKTSPFQGLSEEETHDILSRMLCVHYDRASAWSWGASQAAGGLWRRD